MKAKLNADVTIKKITIFTDSKINYNDEKTHLVQVEGYVSHDYLWKDADQQKFNFDLHADKDLCDAIVKLIEKYLAQDVEQFPREI